METFYFVCFGALGALDVLATCSFGRLIFIFLLSGAMSSICKNLHWSDALRMTEAGNKDPSSKKDGESRGNLLKNNSGNRMDALCRPDQLVVVCWFTLTPLNG